MEQTTSADRTPIAYERSGDGPPLVLVGGALCDRTSFAPLAELLAGEFTVYTYDRRGRGDSGDAAPGAPEREYEDLAAVAAVATAATGTMPKLYGHSSGAALVLQAVAAGVPARGVVAYDPPYSTDESTRSPGLAAQIDALLVEGRRDDAVALFLGGGAWTEQARQEPWWATLAALAHSLPHEFVLLGDDDVPAEPLSRIGVPVLLLNGEHSEPFFHAAGVAVTATVPGARHAVVTGQGHPVAHEVVGPLIASFLRD